MNVEHVEISISSFYKKSQAITINNQLLNQSLEFAKRKKGIWIWIQLKCEIILNNDRHYITGLHEVMPKMACLHSNAKDIFRLRQHSTFVQIKSSDFCDFKFDIFFLKLFCLSTIYFTLLYGSSTELCLCNVLSIKTFSRAGKTVNEFERVEKKTKFVLGKLSGATIFISVAIFAQMSYH